MSMEIQLIAEIEKHEFLYNYNLPEYNRKDLVEEAWANIADETHLSITDCKEKWRNIRSSYLRSMKPSGSKMKKPYYLTEYLKFIVPFLKPITIDYTMNDDDSQSNSVINETVVVVDFIKSEPEECMEQDENNESQVDNGILNDLLAQQSGSQPAAKTDRKRIFQGKRGVANLLKSQANVSSTIQKDDYPEGSSNSKTYTAIKMFLLSLIPELESMSEDQTRLFKIKALMLIDDIKQSSSDMRPNSSILNTDRLQKRMINLLLKNLRRMNKDNSK